MSNLKTIWYYCPGCRLRLDLLVVRAAPFKDVMCNGRIVRMRKLKNQ